MAVMVKRWYRSRRNHFIIFMISLLAIVYFLLFRDLPREANLDLTRSILARAGLNTVVSAKSSVVVLRNNATVEAPLVQFTENIKNRNSVIQYIESRIEEALKEEKGSGCTIPKLDPFAKEVTQFDKVMPDIKCSGLDWVRCYHSECKVVKPILDTMKDIACTYRDIIYDSDDKNHLSQPQTVPGSAPYVLKKSDHVKVDCAAISKESGNKATWSGYTLGFRKLPRKSASLDREKSLNVLILGFDSTAKNGFIRRMPKSYDVLTGELGAVVLNGYNIAGDGTPAALFPILTGKTELELPDVRKKTGHKGHLDSMPFIFYPLNDDGYRTAYFEDMPWIGTFQYRFNGFQRQPADHYLRAFYLQESNNGRKWWKAGKKGRYCVGDRPQYSLMLDITKQFFELDSKKYCFTFIADITHDDFNMISTADERFSQFLRQFKADGRLDDTLLFVMGDHGPRYANVRDTLQGKQEERLPLMAIVLPTSLVQDSPEYLDNLRANAETLTTPFDIHSTVLQAMDLEHVCWLDSLETLRLMPKHDDALRMSFHDFFESDGWHFPRRRPTLLHKYRNPFTVPGADFPRSLSLLEKVPANRSCSEAGIEPHWCACLKWHTVGTDQPHHERAALALLQYINQLTQSERSKCVERTLESIEWVMRQSANSKMLSFKSNKDVDGYIGLFGANTKIVSEYYQVKIAVSPGHGVYEASMKYLIQEDKFEIQSTDISRINAYNNEPHCISDTLPHLNMYCYCND